MAFHPFIQMSKGVLALGLCNAVALDDRKAPSYMSAAVTISGAWRCASQKCCHKFLPVRLLNDLLSGSGFVSSSTSPGANSCFASPRNETGGPGCQSAGAELSPSPAQLQECWVLYPLRQREDLADCCLVIVAGT